LSPEQIKHIFREIAFALKEMHNKQYIHRDIKPSNIFVMKDGTIKLADFSISRPLTGP
jgi:serine/threonine protein kinase